ncbi:MAG: cytochrome P450, partial [Pseudomonadota bacterium]
RQVMGASRLTEDGADWRRKEAVTQPYLARFDPRKLAATSQLHADTLAQSLLSGNTPGRLDQFAIDVATIRVLADTLLDGRMSEMAEEFATDLHVMLDYAASYAFSAPGSNPQIEREAIRSLAHTRQRMLQRLTAARHNLPAGDNVLRALDAADEAGVSGITFQHELMMLFSAGADTSAAALGWCCLALAENQNVQEVVREEVSALSDEQLSDHEALAQLPWLGAFIDETLRLYPPIPMLGRITKSADTIDQIAVEPDTLVFVSLIGIQRDEEMWTNADGFSPARHGIDGKRPARAIPFSSGPRICGGSRFAMIELKTVMATLIRRLRFEPSNLDPGEFQWRISMRRKLGHPVAVMPAD